MKRILAVAIAAMLALQLFAGIGHADTMTYYGTTYMNTLVDPYFYWMNVDDSVSTNSSGLQAKLLAGYTITSAYLIFKNLRDTSAEPNNTLYIGLDNSEPSGGILGTQGTFQIYGDASWVYNQPSSDINGNSTFIDLGSWHDYNYNVQPHAGANVKDILNASQIANFTNLVLPDGKWAIGLDPDCHFTFDEMSFVVEANKVPEPSSLLLLGSGLIGLGFFSIRRKKNS